MSPEQMLKLLRKASRIEGSQLLIERKKLYQDMANTLKQLIKDKKRLEIELKKAIKDEKS